MGQDQRDLPQGKDPQSVTVEEALALIAERAAKSGTGKGKATKAKTTKSSKAATDGATKKTTKAKAPAKAKPKTAAKAKKD
ncbi:topoisomerase C-terminal repeat-containing protein [Ensifer sp. 1H6]|uniref:topoisomerase C-terminal repeat-containing protein n=1 Tax=Ensifer sp. 1H6 TaxID=1911585 RepID=UPI001FD8B21D|nr:topoisomerase C-terminal repeat-containing protein [Ensifer sp. 1H6]